MAAEGWYPPPYPQDRLEGLRSVAEATGAVVDLSVGDPCDPLPPIVADALATAQGRAERYPASIGFPEVREAASGWMQRRLRVVVSAEHVRACVGTKEFVASLPRFLSLRDPARDTILYPAISYPTYAMGATLAGLRAVPVPMGDGWHLDFDAVDEADARRALLLWCNEPANPTGAVPTAGWFEEVVSWGRARGILVASDECYVEFSSLEGVGDRATVLVAGLDGVLAVHSLSKRSNMAGLRVGFIAGDADLVEYLGEVRKHAGLMAAGPVQMAAAVALGDDAHVELQRARYAERRRLFLDALAGTGVEHQGGSGTFYLWLADTGGRDGWELAGDLAKAGIVAAPGDLYGEAPARHVRVALTAPTSDLGVACTRLRHVLGAG